MATSEIVKTLEKYSLEEQIVGTWIDGSPIYRKSKVYTWAGQRLYDSDFFSGINLKQVIKQNIQIMSDAQYAQTSYYWTTSDYARCWIVLNVNPPQVCMDTSASSGAKILITVDYTKA